MVDATTALKLTLPLGGQTLVIGAGPVAVFPLMVTTTFPVRPLKGISTNFIPAATEKSWPTPPILIETVEAALEAVMTKTLSRVQFSAPPCVPELSQVVPPLEQTVLGVVRYQKTAPGVGMATLRVPAL